MGQRFFYITCKAEANIPDDFFKLKFDGEENPIIPLPIEDIGILTDFFEGVKELNDIKSYLEREIEFHLMNNIEEDVDRSELINLIKWLLESNTLTFIIDGYREFSDITWDVEPIMFFNGKRFLEIDSFDRITGESMYFHSSIFVFHESCWTYWDAKECYTDSKVILSPDEEKNYAKKRELEILLENEAHYSANLKSKPWWKFWK